MLKNKYIWILVAIVFVAILFYLTKSKSKSKPSIQPSNSQVGQAILPVSTPEEVITPETSPSPVSRMVNIPPSNNNVSYNIIGERGQITCVYQYPPTPGNFGDAKIEANWNNLIFGKNGTTKLDVCLSVNGNNSLLSTNLNQNGSVTVDAPWISMNLDYTFNLYDDHGGDIGTCGGVILSSCQINTNPR